MITYGAPDSYYVEFGQTEIVDGVKRLNGLARIMWGAFNMGEGCI